MMGVINAEVLAFTGHKVKLHRSFLGIQVGSLILLRQPFFEFAIDVDTTTPIYSPATLVTSTIGIKRTRNSPGTRRSWWRRSSEARKEGQFGATRHFVIVCQNFCFSAHVIHSLGAVARLCIGPKLINFSVCCDWGKNGQG
jgi:hypothetical protein